MHKNTSVNAWHALMSKPGFSTFLVHCHPPSLGQSPSLRHYSIRGHLALSTSPKVARTFEYGAFRGLEAWRKSSFLAEAQDVLTSTNQRQLSIPAQVLREGRKERMAKWAKAQQKMQPRTAGTTEAGP